MAGTLELSEAMIDRGHSVNRSEELIGEFRRRFPLFDGVIGRFGEDARSERIPWFFGFILAAASKPGAGACCVVLDKTPGTTAIAAILSGLMRLQRDFPSLVERYARTALRRGQRVKVRPSDFVYEYEGVWDDFPDFFKLKFLGEEASRSFPLVDVLRLEPTDRVRPKGTGASYLGAFERSPLDRLLDLTTCGNNSLIQNVVLVQIPRVHLARIADATTLAPMHAKEFARLSRFLPWGFIGHEGTLNPSDRFQVIGEPLIAATSVPEDLALASSSAEVGTKTVLVDGARRLARDLQAFDDIADRQRLVILASPDESEDLELLKDRGCPVWHMSADDVLIGEASDGRRTRASLVGATIRAADVRRRCSVNTIDCHDDVLQAAAASLERVAETTEDREEAFEVEESLARLFSILFECSECCFGVGEGTISDLRAAQEQIAQHARWLEPAVREELRDAVNALEHAVTIGSGEQKADAILSILADHDGTWAVAARSPRTAERLRDGLDTLGAGLPVLPVSAVSPDHEFGGIIVPAWPNDQRFTRLRNLSVTPDLRILAYPFESKWVLRHQARERARARSIRLESGTLSSILGIAPRFLTPLNSAGSDVEEPPEKKVPLDFPVFRLEERVTRRRVTHPPLASSAEDSREAQLVQFFGGCYALLTEWAELPLLNDLIDSSQGDNAKLTSTTASRLSTGDFVLFRASGDKEFLRLIAEESLGAQEYQRIRDAAERWKVSLRRLGRGPAAIQRRLADHGLERTPQTVAGWLGNPDRIGPGNYDDIETIATVAGDAELLSIKEEVRDAITRIRGAHLTAGMQLTRLILGELRGRLNELGDQPTLLDLDYGRAWVVQVESVETTRREYAANQVNRLLWVADSAF
ncbi:MAG: DrmE family protein [Bryobacterales bacterium]|nr:DrmE family protein [Bryobacterales bacterium]